MFILTQKLRTNIHIFLLYYIFFTLYGTIKTQQQNLISFPISQLNSEIRNISYTINNFKIISLSIDDMESNGVEFQLGISTSSDSPFPFSSVIKYNQLTGVFSGNIAFSFDLEILYLIRLNTDNSKIFSFSCKNKNSTHILGFYLNRDLIDFEENSFEENKINYNNNFGYVLQNSSNTIAHYMSFNNIATLIIFLDINNEEIKPVILNYESHKSIKCIKFNENNFLCLFVKEINDNIREINIKHFNATNFIKKENEEEKNINSTDSYDSDNNSTDNFIDKYVDNYTDNSSDIISDESTDDDNTDEEENEKDYKKYYEINNTLSFNLSLINNYAFDFYKTDDNHFITCFLINEGNVQKIICYKNIFEELVISPLNKYTVFKSCDIKKDNKPEYFNYEKISIIYVNNEMFKVILYTFDKSRYLIIDLISLVSYVSGNNDFFQLAKISNVKREIYLLFSSYLSTKNGVQYLNIFILKLDTYINTLLDFPIIPKDVKDEFTLESELGEVSLSESESKFILGSYSKETKHSITLIETGVSIGIYKYKDIPSPLLFYYKFIIYPRNCIVYTDDALKCVKCKEGAILFDSLCYSEDAIPAGYYFDTMINDIIKCDDNCYKCNMLKVGGISACIACENNYKIYRYRCEEECPEETYTYSYKKMVKASNFETLRTINVCNDTCEEDYTGYIFQESNDGEIKKLCVLNRYKIINDNIEQKLTNFKSLTIDKKNSMIDEQKNIIKAISNLTSDNDFNNFNVEFLLLNEYIYNTDTLDKGKITSYLSESCVHYFQQIEDYFSSLEGELNILNYNNNENLIYFLSSQTSLLNNNELLEKSYFDKLKNYFFKFGEKLTEISIDFSELEKINVIMNAYVKFINETIDSAVDFIDTKYDQKEFESNKYYRYEHEIILGENNLKLKNLTNSLYKFLIKSNQNLLYYKNFFISFYNTKLSELTDDKEYILYKLGLNLVILGSESKITTSTFNTNNISELIEKNLISEFKIILPSLKSINAEIDWNTTSFGLIIFEGKYPFLNMNSTSYASPNFISINFYDKNFNSFKISGLKEKNEIKIVRKKSGNNIHMGNCVFYDEEKKNLNDIGLNSFDLVDYIICTTTHLSDFTIASFSPSYLTSNYEKRKDYSDEDKLKNSRFFKDRNILTQLTLHNAIIIYLNVTIILLLIFLLIIKFLKKPIASKTEKIIEDSYLRYTINDDTETDKKILKYIIEKEIDYILKNRKDYENQKKQEMALDVKNDVFGGDQKIITIIEDDSDDDDDEEVIEKKVKKVSFKKPEFNGKNSKKFDKKSKDSLKDINSNKKKGKNKHKKEDINIEMAEMKDDNDFIEVDDAEEKAHVPTNRYRYSFNYKNNPRKANLTISHLRNSSYAQSNNANNNGENSNSENQNIVKRQSMNERFKRNVKEQKARHIYSIIDKTLNEYKGSGQNSLEASANIMKRPSSMIGISNALNRMNNNKEEEKILIKNEFFVIFKLMLYILFQYEYRIISLLNQIDLPITRNNLIFLLCFRLSLQLTVSVIISPRYYGDNYSLSSNIIAIVIIILISDIIYTIIELILMKKKVLTSCDIKLKGIYKFKQIMECLFGYILIILILLFGFYNSLWISLYLRENKIKCNYQANFWIVILADNLVYEVLLLIIKSLIFTYVIYQDADGCILKILEIFDKVFIFYLAE